MFRSRLSYRSLFISDYASMFLNILIYYYLGTSIVYQTGIDNYGTTSALSFIISGMLLDIAFNPLRYNFELHPINFYKTLSSPKPIWLFFLQNWAFVLVYIAFYPILYALLLHGFCQLDINYASLVLFTLCMILQSIGLNFITGGVSLIVKRGDLIQTILEYGQQLFGGKQFPTNIMPGILQSLALIFPQYWALLIWRKILFENMFFLNQEFTLFTLVSILTFILGMLMVQKGIDKIYIEGLVL